MDVVVVGVVLPVPALDDSDRSRALRSSEVAARRSAGVLSPRRGRGVLGSKVGVFEPEL